jgi:hypothetical protein
MEFIDPPENSISRKSRIWDERIQTLKENPTRWALIGEFSPGVASQIRSGNYKAFLGENMRDSDSAEKKRYMAANWEVRTARIEDGSRMKMWIRWIG